MKGEKLAQGEKRKRSHTEDSGASSSSTKRRRDAKTTLGSTLRDDKKNVKKPNANEASKVVDCPIVKRNLKRVAKKGPVDAPAVKQAAVVSACQGQQKQMIGCTDKRDRQGFNWFCHCMSRELFQLERQYEPEQLRSYAASCWRNLTDIEKKSSIEESVKRSKVGGQARKNAPPKRQRGAMEEEQEQP